MHLCKCFAMLPIVLGFDLGQKSGALCGRLALKLGKHGVAVIRMVSHVQVALIMIAEWPRRPWLGERLARYPPQPALFSLVHEELFALHRGSPDPAADDGKPLGACQRSWTVGSCLLRPHIRSASAMILRATRLMQSSTVRAPARVSASLEPCTWRKTSRIGRPHSSKPQKLSLAGRFDSSSQHSFPQDSCSSRAPRFFSARRCASMLSSSSSDSAAALSSSLASRARLLLLPAAAAAPSSLVCRARLLLLPAAPPFGAAAAAPPPPPAATSQAGSSCFLGVFTHLGIDGGLTLAHTPLGLHSAPCFGSAVPPRGEESGACL